VDRIKLDTVITLVNGLLNPAGFDCIEADWVGHERILRLFVERAADESGMNLDGCVTATRLINEFAALDDMMPGHYVLEVSSPGVERPLRRLEHFRANLGRRAEVKLREKYNERRQGKGILSEVRAESGGLVTMQTEQGDWSFSLDLLQRASLLYDWGDS
jgi:ribosome maturation factor RimP